MKTPGPHISAGRRDSRRGAVLAVTALIVLLVSILGGGLLTLSRSDALERTRQMQMDQAFWLAEAGLESMAWRLCSDEAFAASLSPFSNAPTTLATEDLGAGSYEVRLWQTPGSSQRVIHVVSAGRVQGTVRRVGQTVIVGRDLWPLPITSNALLSAGTVTLNNKVEVSGPVSIDTNIATLHGDGTYDFVVPPDPVPPLNITSYERAIDYAEAHGMSPSSASNVVLGGGVLCVKGDLTTWSIQGPGTLVVSGSLSMGARTGVSPGVTVIAGKSLVFGQGVIVSNECVLYASQSIQFNQGGSMLLQSSLLTPGSITGNQSFALSGLLYAGGALELRNSASLTGCVVAGASASFDVALLTKVSITHDPSQLPEHPPPGFNVVWRREGWEEW